MRKIKIHSPGTVANLVCGFDILGMALQEPFDIMELQLLDEPVVLIHNEDEFDLPEEPTRNVAGVVLLAIMEKIKNAHGFRLTVIRNSSTGIRFNNIKRDLFV